MADQQILDIKPRTERGTAACRRLRAEGIVPGNIYGHNQEPEMISATGDSLHHIIHAGAHVVDISIDGKTEKAMFKEIQWDTFGIHLYHFDLVRVDANERVVTEIPIDLRGTAPGTQRGGILEHHLHSVEIDCLAVEIPAHFELKILGLEIGGKLTLADIKLPPSAKFLLPEDTVVVEVVEARVAPEEEAGEGGPAEPELVGREKDEENEG